MLALNAIHKRNPPPCRRSSARRRLPGASMHPRHLEEPVAFRRGHLLIEAAAIALDPQRDSAPALPQRPDAAEQAGEIARHLPGDGLHHVTDLQARALGRAAIGDADDDDPVLDLGSVESEPWPRGCAAASRMTPCRFARIERLHRGLASPTIGSPSNHLKRGRRRGWRGRCCE